MRISRKKFRTFLRYLYLGLAQIRYIIFLFKNCGAKHQSFTRVLNFDELALNIENIKKTLFRVIKSL